METTSTPRRHARRSLLEHIPIRSAKVAGNNAQQTPADDHSVLAADLEPVNDEDERLVRRSGVEIHRRVSNLPSSSNRRASLIEPAKYVGEEEIAAHFQTCVRLHTENKITAKNAWELFITDFLKDMIRTKGDEALHIGAISLGVCAKVYCVRVDSLYDTTMKFANNMAMSHRKRKNDQNGDEINNDNEDHEDTTGGGGDGVAATNEKEKRKRRRRILSSNGPKATIDTKGTANLLVRLPKLESVFFSNQEDLNKAPIDNLFTNRLPLHPCGHTFLLNNEPYFVMNQANRSELNRTTNRKYPLDLIQLNSDFELCTPFRDFRIDEWNPDEEDKRLEMSLMNNTPVVYDDNGLPIPDLDGSLHNIFVENHENDPDNIALCDGDNDDDDHNNNNNDCLDDDHHLLNDDIVMLDNIPRHQMIYKRTDYTYNTLLKLSSGKVMDKIWAGPSHWKIKYMRRLTARFSGRSVHEQVVARAARKRAITHEKIAFCDDDISQYCKNDKIKPRKKITSADYQQTTLPQPNLLLNNYIASLTELGCKPGVHLKLPQNENDKREIDCQIGAYDYNNLNDSQYCPQNTRDDVNNHNNDDDNDDDGEGHHDNDLGEIEMQDVQQQNFMSENLIDIPTLVPKGFINYAQQAKRMNMAKLKRATWRVLTESTDPNEMVVKAKYFSQLYKTLPTLVSSDMAEALSAPLAFVSVLHLANENNLKFIQIFGEKDFEIQGNNQQSTLIHS